MSALHSVDEMRPGLTIYLFIFIIISNNLFTHMASYQDPPYCHCHIHSYLIKCVMSALHSVDEIRPGLTIYLFIYLFIYNHYF